MRYVTMVFKQSIFKLVDMNFFLNLDTCREDN